MIKIIKFDENRTMMYPNGEIATGERIKNDYPAVAVFPHIMETDDREQICYAIQNLSAARSSMGIDPSLTDDEAIQKIQEIRNQPPEQQVQAEPTAEERIAAALEFQNMLSL